jgi:hypothetical protein
MSNIIWLASYPKSGNTWFRVCLSNLTSNSDKPASINNLERTPIASARGIFDSLTGLEASDLTFSEIDRIRPEVYQKLSDDAQETLFMKVHDAYTLLDDGKTPLFPTAASRGVIYFLRNPLDVAVSYAHHSGCDYDQAITWMSAENHSFCSKPKRLHNQLRQKLLSWSSHPLSWLENPEIPVCLLRYEDMQQNPATTFLKAVTFAGLDYNLAEVGKALSLSTFEKLQEQEQQDGFQEKSQSSDSFFRKGKIGSWREELTDKQAITIINNHRQTMQHFGYINDHGEPVF